MRLPNGRRIGRDRARQLFWEGFLGAFDIFGAAEIRYQRVEHGEPQDDRGLTPEEIDAKAIASDWRAVGDDLRDAMGVVDRELARHD